uniref:endonuclease III n=1 Tax=uncultured Draconibacterium sp. TaxID=1573823 RepID=UPI00321674BC
MKGRNDALSITFNMTQKIRFCYTIRLKKSIIFGKNLNVMRKRELFDFIIQYFEETMPVAETELDYGNPFELIVAVILSAQCTDKRVNQITPDLLKRFPTPEKMAEVDPAEVFDYIKSCSYPNNKAKHLVGMSQKLLELFDGEVPGDVDDLQKLPGVGRKTANVIASVVFNKPALAVDTHVFRVAARIGLSTNAKTPLATEQQLMKYIPEELVPKAHHWLILHGRYTCIARKPKCNKCGLTEVCKYYKKEVTGTTK